MKLLKLNSKQKRTMYIALAIIALSLIVWLGYGQEIFTKTEVLVEVKDEMFDRTYQEWQKKFIWGLDLSMAISGFTAIVSIIIIYIQKTKRSNNEG
ncbi:MAG: hypothetical protein V3V16_10950 [Melioribacteraceae bacterium]